MTGGERIKNIINESIIEMVSGEVIIGTMCGVIGMIMLWSGQGVGM